MIRLLVFLFLCGLLCPELAAQSYRSERNGLSGSIGISHFVQEKKNALTAIAAFNRHFLPNTSIEISASGSLPVDVNTNEEEQQLSALRFGMNLYYHVLDTRRQAFQVGLGLSAGFFQTKRTVLATQFASDDNDFKPGVNVLFQYYFLPADRWLIGARASLSRFDNERSIWYFGALAGFRF